MKWMEIEIRIFFENSNDIDNWLMSNATKKAVAFQHDTYYQPRFSPFLVKQNLNIKSIDKWLRVREEQGEVILCYKHQHRNCDSGDSIYADEVEVQVSDKDAIDKIMTCLDFEVIAEVRKKRTKWLFDNFEIDVDDVDGLGRFYEIEFQGDVKSPEMGRSFILDFLDEHRLFGWSLIDKAYPLMLLEKA